MRITHGMGVITYLRNLETIQNDKYKNEIRLSTGKNIVNLSDAPDKLVKAKAFNTLIKQNENYRFIIDQTTRELAAVEDRLLGISNKIADIRQLAIDSTHAGSSGNTFTIGVYIKGLLDDILTDANADFNGKFLFSGTKTTHDSIQEVRLNGNKYPFEIIQSEPTAGNPSGLEVVFKGNFHNRYINKDNRTAEAINVTADRVFGEGGAAFFNDIIALYNVMSFKADGSNREIGDAFSREEVANISDIQQRLATINEKLNNTTSQMSSKRLRMETISFQMAEESLRYEEMRTINEDTDFAKTTMDLRLQEIALQYSLKVGTRLMQTTLMDFLR